MDKLFIELYLDEDVDVLIAELIRARGYVASTAQEAGLLNRTDTQQLEFAVQQGKALVSHNKRDFQALGKEYNRLGIKHYGIILAARRSPYEIARRLLVILDSVSSDQMQDQIRYI